MIVRMLGSCLLFTSVSTIIAVVLIVRAMLEDGVNPDVANKDGRTALHLCCLDGMEDMLLLLLDHGANVNARDDSLWTPLHCASSRANLHLFPHLFGR